MMTICSILILLIHESGRVFHLLMLSSIYFFDVLMLLLNSLSLAWLELSSGFFPVLFCFGGNCERCYSSDFFLNPIVNFIYETTGFCILILYPTTLLKVCIICKSFLVQFLRFLLYHIISFANKETFISFWSIYIPDLLQLSYCYS